MMPDILLIEDDQQVRDMLSETLRQAGHTVRTAENGTRGIALYAEQPPDVLITDLVMPGQEGIETIEKIRQEYRDANIIAISGGGAVPPSVYLDLASQLGADRALKKPIKTEAMLNAIRELCNNDMRPSSSVL